MSYHQTILHAIKSGRRTEINYIEEPLDAQQKRLQGRVYLRPDVDLSTFTTRAVIDWLDIQFTTGRKTQAIWIFRWIEKATGLNCRTDQLDADDGRLFKVRFQEPAFTVVWDALAAIRSNAGIDGDVILGGLEISIDFTPKVPGNDDERAKLLAVLTRHFMPERDILSLRPDRPRFVWGIGSEFTAFILPMPRHRRKMDPLLFSKNDLQPYSDATVYYGEKGGHCAWRLMDKTIDNQNIQAGTVVILPDCNKRVRIEVTMNYEELSKLGLNTLDDLHAFKFTRLSRYFRFLLPTFPGTSGQQTGVMKAVRQKLIEERITKFLRTGVVGLQAMDRARSAQAVVHRREMRAIFRRKHKRLETRRAGLGPMLTFTAFDDLNKRVEMSLRKLTGRVGKQWV